MDAFATFITRLKGRHIQKFDIRFTKQYQSQVIEVLNNVKFTIDELYIDSGVDVLDDDWFGTLTNVSKFILNEIVLSRFAFQNIDQVVDSIKGCKSLNWLHFLNCQINYSTSKASENNYPKF